MARVSILEYSLWFLSQEGDVSVSETAKSKEFWDVQFGELEDGTPTLRFFDQGVFMFRMDFTEEEIQEAYMFFSKYVRKQ